MKAQFQGFSQFKKDWKLREIRLRKWGGILPDLHEITDRENGEELLLASDEQDRSLLERLNNGIVFAHLDSGIKRMAKELLAVLLTPLGKPIPFVEESHPNARGLLDFLDTNNHLIEQRVQQLQEQEAKLLS